MLAVEPPQTAPGTVIAAEGEGLIGTVRELEAGHPALLVTVTPSVTSPVAPAVKAIERVPAPEVIEPLLIVQV